jgi:hypothetical protein
VLNDDYEPWMLLLMIVRVQGVWHAQPRRSEL